MKPNLARVMRPWGLHLISGMPAFGHPHLKLNRWRSVPLSTPVIKRLLGEGVQNRQEFEERQRRERARLFPEHAV